MWFIALHWSRTYAEEDKSVTNLRENVDDCGGNIAGFRRRGYGLDSIS